MKRQKRHIFTVTKYKKIEMIEVEKKRWKNNNSYAIKPNIILQYNDDMDGVDLQDNYLFSFSLMRKYVKNQ